MNVEGLIKSVLLLMLIGEEEVVQVFKFFVLCEVQKIGVVMVVLKNVMCEQVEDVLQDFVKEVEQYIVLLFDLSEYICLVLMKVFGEDKVGVLIDCILQGSDMSGIEGLKWMDLGVVVELIKNEYLQIIVMIFVYFDCDQVLEIVLCFIEWLCNDVLLWIVMFDGIQLVVLCEFDDVLMGLLFGSDNLKCSLMGGICIVVEILNFMMSVYEEGVFESVCQYDVDFV